MSFGGRITTSVKSKLGGAMSKLLLHLIGLISTPIPTLSQKGRAVKRAKELQLAWDTADCSCEARWRTCPDCKAEQAVKKAEELERAYPGISMLWRRKGS